MKAVFVIDVDKDELGKAFATITAEENDISFFARGVIRPLPQKKNTSKLQGFGNTQIVWTDRIIHQNEGWNDCLDEIVGETE